MRDPEQIDVRELDPWPPRLYVGNRGDVITMAMAADQHRADRHLTNLSQATHQNQCLTSK